MMGRTNPTYRDWLEQTEANWQPFRRALRRRQQAAFDRLFERASDHADAAGYVNVREPEYALFMSILLAQERELRALEQRLDEETDPATDETDGV